MNNISFFFMEGGGGERNCIHVSTACQPEIFL